MAKVIEKMGIAKVSSKGQLVIPQDIRKRMKIRDGSMVAVASYGDLVILKKIENLVSERDLQSLKLVDETWDDLAKGKYRKLNKEAFLRELETW